MAEISFGEKMMVAFQMAKAKAIANEFLKQGHQFRENTAIRHGLHKPDDLTEITNDDIEKYIKLQSDKPDIKPVTPTPVPNIAQNVEVTDSKKGLLQTVGVPLTIAAGFLGGGYLIGDGLKQPSAPPIVTQAPVLLPAPAPSILPQIKTGDLLKYLKDEGYNLPPKNRR